MILLLRGGDELGVRRRIQALKVEADGGTGMLTTNLTVLEGRDAKPEDILGPAMTPPFLAPKRLVIVERFLDRWEADPPSQAQEGGGQPRQPREPRGRPLGPFDGMLKSIESGIPETTMLVLTGGEPKGGINPVVARLAKAGATEELHSEPKKDQLLRYIRDEGAARGIRFKTSRAQEQHWDSGEWMQKPETDPVALIGAVSQGSTLDIANELDKLALYTMGREVTVDDVYNISSGDRDVTSFNFLDAIQDGKVGDAIHHMERLNEKEDIGQLLLTNLTTRFRQTATIAELMEENASEDEIGKAMGGAGKWPGLRQAGMRRAKRYGSEGARQALALIAEADYRGKKGEIDNEVALELLVVKLARMAAAGSR
jgi:hypothetical protein